MMDRQYQNGPPEPGKWYVSELPPNRRRTRSDPIIDSPTVHYTRLAGGFLTEEEAKDAKAELEVDRRLRPLYVWQCPCA